MLAQLGLSFLVSLLAAIAVHFGFGPGFVDDALAYPIVIYAALVAAFLTRQKHGRWLALRLLCAALVAGLTLLTLRTWLRFDLPFGEFQTTGHSPFFALPVSVLIAALGVLALERAIPTKPAGE